MMATLEHDWTSDPAPLEVVETLRRAGHEAWLAGGCVRDLLLGRSPKDFDVATSATPDEVRATFRRTIPVKPELGVTLVLAGDQRIETTTFRTEGEYLDGRRPSYVGPATSRQDVRRRDFTVNGLLLDPSTGQVVDHVGGLDDLRAGVLRCIGDPRERFGEDHLRILRAVRFSVRFGFGIEASTWSAMTDLSGQVATLSGERLHEELERMFEFPFAPALRLLDDCGALRAISPRLADGLGNPATKERMESLCSSRLPATPGLWVAVLLLPLCPWFSGSGASDDATTLREPVLERLRASRQEADAARLCWTRFPDLLAPLGRPSSLAPILRDRHWPVLRDLARAVDSIGLFEDIPLEELDRIHSSIPPAPPALGQAFLDAGVPKGPLLGEAVRMADRLILDENRNPGADLVREIAESILVRS